MKIAHLVGYVYFARFKYFLDRIDHGTSQKGLWFLVSGFRISGFWFPVSGFWSPFSDFLFLVSDFWFVHVLRFPT